MTIHTFNNGHTSVEVSQTTVTAIYALMMHGINFNNGRKVDSIKLLRNIMPIGLKEAKDVVDYLFDNMEPDASGYIHVRGQSVMQYLGKKEY